MKEKLYVIPINDAFNEDCECTLCFMRECLEKDAVEFVLGPSYMDDDIRGSTNKLGFCDTHIKLLYQHQNRFGLALILKSYMECHIRAIEDAISEKEKALSSKFFNKRAKDNNSNVVSYINTLNNSCYICQRIDQIFSSYISTIFYLFKTDDNFSRILFNSKGFCATHYALLYDRASEYLNNEKYNIFIKGLNELYLKNFKRVSDDLEWFINKFDYRYADEPWKNSKDALFRSIVKTN